MENKMKKLFFLVLVITALSADEKSMGECIADSGGATWKMRDCGLDEMRELENKLEVAYNNLYDALRDKKSKESLKKSFDSWLVYIKNRFTFLDYYYMEVFQGSMAVPMGTAEINSEILNKIKEFEKNLNVLKEFGD